MNTTHKIMLSAEDASIWKDVATYFFLKAKVTYVDKALFKTAEITTTGPKEEIAAAWKIAKKIMDNKTEEVYKDLLENMREALCNKKISDFRYSMVARERWLTIEMARRMPEELFFSAYMESKTRKKVAEWAEKEKYLIVDNDDGTIELQKDGKLISTFKPIKICKDPEIKIGDKFHTAGYGNVKVNNIFVSPTTKEYIYIYIFLAHYR
jgi:hypothetical protein